MLGITPSVSMPMQCRSAGINQLDPNISMNWRGNGISVNAIAPGYIETDLNRDFLAGPAGEKIVKRVAQRRFGQVADLEGVLLLLTPAGSYMTGEIVTRRPQPQWNGENMDFALPPEIDDYRARIRAFVDAHISLLEADSANYDEHENIRPNVLEDVRAKVKAEGLWLQMLKERGGRGLSAAGMTPCYEEMNRSIFGPVCFNPAAPDDGNMIILNKIGTDVQKERWLQPIIDGKVRSSFAMTEPASVSDSTCPRCRPRPIKKATPGSLTGASGSSPAPARRSILF